MTSKTTCLFTAVCMTGLLALGCNQPTEEAKTAETATATVAANIAAADCSTEGGCCGGCATAGTAPGKANGCCGKCAGEQVTASKPTDACGDCTACAEGDSANCKCGDQPTQTEKTSTKDSEKSDKHVNSMPEDRDIFHFLLQNHTKLTRKVTELENGVETLTESSDPALVGKIQEHVASMAGRVEDGRRIRMWDELYQEIFKHADKIEMKLENTEHGIKVVETSDDPYVVKLIQSHAKVVSGFVEKGFEEAQQNHEPPQQ